MLEIRCYLDGEIRRLHFSPLECVRDDEEEAERGKIMFYRSARGHVCNQSLGVIRAFTAMLRFTCRCVFWPEVYFTQDQCDFSGICGGS